MTHFRERLEKTNGKGWYVYGPGKISSDGRQGVPDPATRFYEFTGAMFSSGNQPGLRRPTDHPPTDAEPIDVSTGLYLMQKTDLYLPDVIPIAVTRTYNAGDGLSRAFGFGMMNPYAIFVWSAQQWQQADLVLPDGSLVHYVRTSPGTGCGRMPSSVRQPRRRGFYKSTIVWNGNGMGSKADRWHGVRHRRERAAPGDSRPVREHADDHARQWANRECHARDVAETAAGSRSATTAVIGSRRSVFRF